ncbi:hypothetical protein AAU61_09915 [Desulfocarbo indianensis]|nr:hypothetical protein AAU61_09915 [Desulfocarbo indianensis]
MLPRKIAINGLTIESQKSQKAVLLRFQQPVKQKTSFIWFKFKTDLIYVIRKAIRRSRQSRMPSLGFAFWIIVLFITTARDITAVVYLVHMPMVFILRTGDSPNTPFTQTIPVDRTR